ncbi:MAG: glycosyltransferase family 4 protein [Jaaginema sp. PMC 1079.18]|nr:glycosyltransferase family 4 protein [Jaaginema sp. PMC 1080.18]MEC4853607.1 glycosyltransferase family 4 protein [Jaaginema sp. PMC 1079.18]MEC4868315.1 glycosyltransferase family 4 protein [Jaaginema sp. PMC 1078.18]
MNPQNIKALLVIEQCNPEWASVPLEGYNYFQGISQLVDVTLVTHKRNQEAIERLPEKHKVIYITEGKWATQYYKMAEQLVAKGKVNWPLYHALTYPIYEDFNRKVYRRVKKDIEAGQYDIVHALTPMMPRYPFKVVQACQNTPFLLGPVNGGVPFPPGFRETARKENANLNFLRALGRYLIPGYRQTYLQADKVLAGSSYTLDLVKNLFNLDRDRVDLFYENGIPETFVNENSQLSSNDKVKLLFVGRLVPYKCADVVVEAISLLPEDIRQQVEFTIVGGGEEEARLKNQVRELNLEAFVQFAGWVKQKETLQYYRTSDIFCFPSIREFGGAVVLEAMASGLPCIVANNGGIGEYVTEENGFKIDPLSREYLVKETADKIKTLVANPQLREQMSLNAIARAKEFVWSNKAKQMVEIYQEMISV